MVSEATVGPMKKVALTIRTADSPAGQKSIVSDTPFTFIYGIGAEGMSAFEQALYGKKAGDKVSIRIESNNLHAYFEHLFCPLAEVVRITPPATITIKINAVSDAPDLEIIKALAQTSAGCDGDCDCGCGC